MTSPRQGLASARVFYIDSGGHYMNFSQPKTQMMLFICPTPSLSVTHTFLMRKKLIMVYNSLVD